MKTLLIILTLLLLTSCTNPNVYALKVISIKTGELLYYEGPITLDACTYLQNGFRDINNASFCINLSIETIS